MFHRFMSDQVYTQHRFLSLHESSELLIVLISHQDSKPTMYAISHVLTINLTSFWPKWPSSEMTTKILEAFKTIYAVMFNVNIVS